MNREITDILPGFPAELEGMSSRPKILRDIVLVPIEDGILIDGLARKEIIRGPIAQTILPDLLALMDGTRTLNQLVDTFPTIPSDYVRTAVSLLTEWGMVENDADRTDPSGANAETLAFLRRCISNSEVSHSGCEAYTRLLNAQVVLVAGKEPDDQSDCLRLLLGESGVGSVTIVGRDRFRVDEVPHQALVVALTTGGEDFDFCTELDRGKFEPGLSWLRAVVDEDRSFADAGPLFKPGGDTCYRCFRSVHAGPVKGLTPHQLSIDDGRSWASLLAVELIYILALPNLAISGRDFRRFRLPDWDSHGLSYPRVPGCPRCRKHALCPVDRHFDQRAESEHLTDTALVFEEYVGMESRVGLSPSAREQFAQISFVLSREGKKLPNCEQVSLRRGNLELEQDTLEALRTDKVSSGDRFTLDDLAAILAMTAGVREITGNKVQRWAATAGNLGSVELFVAARNVEGLEEGFYFYQAEEHTLAAFRKRGALGIGGFMRRVLGRNQDDLPDALVVLTGAFHRVARKYGSFGYRLINLDAGSALSQLHLVSRSLNIWSRTVTRWADDLIEEQLNLSPFEEQSTAVVELSRRARKKRRRFSFRTRPFPQSNQPRSWKIAQEFRGLSSQEVARALFTESRTKEVDFPWVGHKIPNELIKKTGGDSGLVTKLPKPTRGGLSVGSILANRTSTRYYSQRPVSAGYIGTALHYAHSADLAEWLDEHQCGLPLTYVVLARNVLEIDAGVYEYDPDRHRLIHLAAPLSHQQNIDLLVQSEYADAPFLVWIAGNLAAACARHGANGHRQLLLRAGAAGHRLWMTVLGLGLVGSIFAGLIPGAARRLLGMDGYKKASLFAFTAGYQLCDSRSHNSVQ